VELTWHLKIWFLKSNVVSQQPFFKDFKGYLSFREGFLTNSLLLGVCFTQQYHWLWLQVFSPTSAAVGSCTPTFDGIGAIVANGSSTGGYFATKS